METSIFLQKILDHSLLILAIKPFHCQKAMPLPRLDMELFHNQSLNEKLLDAWVGGKAWPKFATNWASWVKATMEMVIFLSRELSREFRGKMGVQICCHNKKVQLVEVQL
jgi:hypothetical protein